MTSLLNKTTRPGGFFITGTDTDVGKTFVAGCLAHTLIQQGQTVIPRKPIASGCIKQDDGSLLSEDALFLQQACQSPESLSTICPNQFEPAISPQTAIQQAGLSITTKYLVSACQLPTNIPQKYTYIVEGAGGFYSPICSDGLNRDLAKQLNFPVILVVKNTLGCINHTLLTVEAIQQSGLQVAAIILNHFSTLEEQTNPSADLSDWTDIPIYKVSYSEDKSLQIIDRLAL